MVVNYARCVAFGLWAVVMLQCFRAAAFQAGFGKTVASFAVY